MTLRRSTTVRGRLRLAVAGAVALTALTAATAGAAVPPLQIPIAPATQPDRGAAGTGAPSGGGPTAPRGPRSQFPVFVLDKGRYTGFDSPGEVTNDSLVRINNHGQIAGAYVQDYTEDSSGAPQGRFRGFLRDTRGRISTISVPGAAGTTPYDFNDAGTIVGVYSDESLNRTDDLRSFLRDARGRYTRIVVPGATQVQARGINNRGLVVGEYRDAAGAFHGFRWQRGRVSSFHDAPGGAVTVCSPLDVNDRGQMVGLYLDAATRLHGCLLDRGRAVTIDAPGVPLTLPIAIKQPRPDRGRHQHRCGPASPRLPAARRRHRPVHAHRRARRAGNRGHRHQRRRHDRGILRESRGAAPATRQPAGPAGDAPDPGGPLTRIGSTGGHGGGGCRCSIRATCHIGGVL
jgi:hypothetical protein